MAQDQRKRQKKLERKLAKRKEHKQVLTQRNPTDLKSRFQRAASAPIVHSLVSDSLWDQGIGYVTLSREIGFGQIAFAIFLVDMYCLGVKDVISGIRSSSEVNEIVARFSENSSQRKMAPEGVRKLVEGAVDYAHNSGLAPHEDYYKVKPIFGDLDASAYAEEFEYGKDGKPLFIAGPNDSETRCWEIIHRMNAAHGKEGHHFLMPVGDLSVDEDDDEEWDDDEGDEV